MTSSSSSLQKNDNNNNNNNNVLSSLIVGSSDDASNYPRPPSPQQPTWVARAVIRAARARWFVFLRRVFHYQNGGSGNAVVVGTSDPFNSGRWMAMELVCLTVQICVTWVTLLVSREERPVWPMRMWVVGYDFGCFISLIMLYFRYRCCFCSSVSSSHGRRGENEPTGSSSSSSSALRRVKSSLDLFYAMWFVMGNVWAFDARPVSIPSSHDSSYSFHQAPRLHALCVTLLAWNAICYAFPFLLFLLLCVFLPLLSGLTGYNLASALRGDSKGASEDEIQGLLSWRFKEADLESNTNSNSAGDHHDIECCCCCICLAKYRDKEEIRELPCRHVFHQNCVDQWLRIISCCPLCKQPINAAS